MRLASSPHRPHLRIACTVLAGSILLLAATASLGEEPAIPTQATIPVRVCRGAETSIVLTREALRDLPVQGLGDGEPLLSFRGARREVAAAQRKATPVDARPEPSSWLAAFERIYESGDSAAYGALLGEDYRFVSGDADLEARFPEGFTRRDELSSYARLFRGAIAADGTPLPRALRVDVVWQDVRVLPDPEFPDDPAHALVHVGQATLAIGFADGSSMRDTAPHAFWLVLAAGERAWICRRWVERPASEALAGIADPPGAIVLAADAPNPALAPSWIPFPNPAPAGAGVSYAYDVAAAGEDVALELFDAAGRRVTAIERGARAAGRHVARWNGRNDAGVRVAPGVYFLWVRVGVREERSRVIVVR